MITKKRGRLGYGRRTRERTHPVEPILGGRDLLFQFARVRHPFRLSKLNLYLVDDPRAVLAGEPRRSLEDVTVQQERRGAHVDRERAFRESARDARARGEVSKSVLLASLTTVVGSKVLPSSTVLVVS